MVEVRIYVEGGGDSVAQAAPLRKALSDWIARALGPEAMRPKIIACGSRRRAYEHFCDGRRQWPGALCLLLVDSEAPVSDTGRWSHVRQRAGDAWKQPDGATDDELHFMAQVMETWLLADPSALMGYFGDGFSASQLPGHPDLENLAKEDVYRRLREATRSSHRGPYEKGRDLHLLGLVDPVLVQRRCRHAGAFVQKLQKSLTPSPP